MIFWIILICVLVFLVIVDFTFRKINEPKTDDFASFNKDGVLSKAKDIELTEKQKRDMARYVTTFDDCLPEVEMNNLSLFDKYEAERAERIQLQKELEKYETINLVRTELHKENMQTFSLGEKRLLDMTEEFVTLREGALQIQDRISAIAIEIQTREPIIAESELKSRSNSVRQDIMTREQGFRSDIALRLMSIRKQLLITIYGSQK
jgi:hypothetical protein